MLTLTRAPRRADPDLALWTKASEGEDAAREELVERAWRAIAPRLRPFAPEDRDEIRQEIATSVLRALDSGDGPDSNLGAFLEWRGRAAITAFVRARIRNRRITHVSEITESAGPADSPLARASVRELDALMRECSGQIPNSDHRSAWQDRYLNGLEPQEIAEQRRTSSMVVRAWICRAARLVRDCVRRKLGDGDDS